MNAHQLDANGVILNTIVVDSLDVFPNLVDASIGGSIGDRIINGAVIPKPVSPPSVPEFVAMWQARAVMIEEGILESVTAYLAAMPDEIKRKQAQAKFEYSSTVRRDDPLVLYVIPALGKTEAQIDAMFFRASAL